MRIVFVIKTLSVAGGAERVLTQISGGLAALGHQVDVVSQDPVDQQDFYPLDGRVRRVRLGVGDAAAASGVIDTLKRIWALRRTLRATRPDVVVGFMYSSFTLAGISRIGMRAPVIASEHIVFDHYRRKPFHRLWMMLGYLLSARMVVISGGVRNTFPLWMHQRMDVIPNPVEPRGESRQGRKKREKQVLTVGRLEHQKDHRTLIESFARLAPDFPGWVLKIIGEGSLRPELEHQIHRLGMARRVLLPGTTVAMDKAYDEADLFVLPSRYESFGLVTAEAAARGLAVIGFADCPGTNELIKHGVNGELVEGRGRVEALEHAMRKLMASPELRSAYGSAGPKSVEAYGLPNVIAAWDRLLGAVAACPR